MELTKEQVKRTKGVAIIFMVILHLFCRRNIKEYYDVYLYIQKVPLIYYIALLGGSCVPIYCFSSGYGLYIGYKNNEISIYKKITKFDYLNYLLNFGWY